MTSHWADAQRLRSRGSHPDTQERFVHYAVWVPDRTVPILLLLHQGEPSTQIGTLGEEPTAPQTAN